MKFVTKPIRYYPPHLRQVATLHYLGKLKIQLFCRCGRKRKQLAFLVDSSFVIHHSSVTSRLTWHCQCCNKYCSWSI